MALDWLSLRIMERLGKEAVRRPVAEGLTRNSGGSKLGFWLELASRPAIDPIASEPPGPSQPRRSGHPNADHAP